jgi:hypothetical protein
MATGVGEGISAFIGLSEKNYMWIATLDPSSNNLVNEQRIQFNEGDVLILPFGTVHAGDRNRTRGIPSYKVFTEIYTIQQDKKRERARLDSRSQLWIVEGEGFIRQKQSFQLGTDRCLVPLASSSKKRKRIDT